jgi:ribosome maturation factor RimP
MCYDDENNRLYTVVDQALHRVGLQRYAIQTAQAGATVKLRVLADREGGVTVRECEEAAREINMLLGVNQVFSVPYSLEVSSPGIDRPLKTREDFERNRGRDVKVVYREPATQTVLTCRGRIIASGEKALSVQSTNGDTCEIGLDTIVKAHIEVRFK